MARAVGVGGVFLKASDPKKLSAWYAEHLGIPSQQVAAGERGAEAELFGDGFESGDDGVRALTGEYEVLRRGTAADDGEFPGG